MFFDNIWLLFLQVKGGKVLSFCIGMYVSICTEDYALSNSIKQRIYVHTVSII